MSCFSYPIVRRRLLKVLIQVEQHLLLLLFDVESLFLHVLLSLQIIGGILLKNLKARFSLDGLKLLRRARDLPSLLDPLQVALRVAFELEILQKVLLVTHGKAVLVGTLAVF